MAVIKVSGGHRPWTHGCRGRMTPSTGGRSDPLALSDDVAEKPHADVVILFGVAPRVDDDPPLRLELFDDRPAGSSN